MDTEIPQLQEHAKRLTVGGRISTSRLFLNELNQLLNSMKLWAVDGTHPTVIRKELKVDEQVLNGLFTRLDNVGNPWPIFSLRFTDPSF